MEYLRSYYPSQQRYNFGDKESSPIRPSFHPSQLLWEKSMTMSSFFACKCFLSFRNMPGIQFFHVLFEGCHICMELLDWLMVSAPQVILCFANLALVVLQACQ